MGHYVDSNNIRCFEPDNDEKTLYIRCEYNPISLNELRERCKNHFPNASFSDLKIEVEHIHTRCLGYDRYDSSDYTNYLVVTWNKRKE